jgi:hypothetical protein
MESDSLRQSVSFKNIVDLLVWGTSGVALGLGVYNLQVLDNAFVFWSAVAYVVGLFSIAPIFRADTMLRRYSYQRLASVVELLLIINLVINGWGALGWYRTLQHYDDFVHFATPAMITWGCGMWYTARIALRKQMQTLPKRAWWILLFALTICLLWEPIEFYGDQLLGTQTYGQAGQVYDTWYDLLMDMLGVIVGWLIFLETRLPMLHWVQKIRNKKKKDDTDSSHL